MKKSLLTFVKFALVMLVLDWILGAGRFVWAPIVVPFAIVNSPSGFLFLWLEQQSASWWQANFGIDDEIGQFIAFFGMILFQAGGFAFLCAKFFRSRAVAVRAAEPSLQ